MSAGIQADFDGRFKRPFAGVEKCGLVWKLGRLALLVGLF
jgi:hypothetical protein